MGLHRDEIRLISGVGMEDIFLCGQLSLISGGWEGMTVNIDRDPEKSYCSKIHGQIYQCISSSFKMISTVGILPEEI